MEFLTPKEAETFFAMIKGDDLQLVHMALDMILNNPDLYLPYRFNSKGTRVLQDALRNAHCDTSETRFEGYYSEGKGARYVRVPTRTDALQKRLNLVRHKHTMPWDWRMIE